MSEVPRTAGELGVAVVGYSFMGKAHSNAWRNVAAFRPDAPAIRQQVLVGRDTDQVAAAVRSTLRDVRTALAVLERHDLAARQGAGWVLVRRADTG